MDNLQSLQKQQELQRMEQGQEQLMEQSRTVSMRPEMAQNTKSKKNAEQISQIKNTMQEFASDFKNEWGKPIKVDTHFISRGWRWFKRKTGISESGPKTYFTMNSFAYGDDTTEKNEERSGTATDLMDSLRDWFELTQDKESMPEPAECVNRLLELSMASGNYCLMHEKKFFYNVEGKGRAEVADKVRKMVSGYLDKMLTEKDKEEIYTRGDADFELGESDKTIEKDLSRAAKAYRNYVLQTAKKCQGHLVGEMAGKKLKALRLNERKIKIYRDRVPEEKRDPLINFMIHEYEECLAWEKLQKCTRGDEQLEEESLDGMINDHLVEEGEIESFEKDKIVPENDDEELEPEQLKGINDIDNWLMRNFQNGGVLGAILPFLKNTNMSFVERVLSMSKRERLHMYYLVENKKRKDSNMLDVGLSQTYVPNLEAFKDQMVATKLKFWKRMNGEYTYMHKLSEAFQVTAEYRKEIKAVAEVERDKKKQLQTIDNKKKEDAPQDIATERLQKMMLLKGALEEYNRNLQAAKKADKKKKASSEAICKESAAYCEQLMKEICDLDDSVEKDKLYMRQSATTENEVIDANGKVNVFGKVPGGTMTGLTKATMFGAKWDLDSAGWKDANLWTGSVGEAIGGVTNLIGAVTSLVSLCKTGDQMAAAEISEKTLQITQSLVSATHNALNIKSLVDVGGAILKTTEQIQAQKVMGAGFAAAGAVISAGITISKAVAVDKMQRHGEKAGEYFKKKREALEKNGKDKLTKEQKRELKYEKNMMKLQEDLQHREEIKAAYSCVGTGVSIASIALPMVGFANIAVSIVGSIHDGIEVGKLRTTLFDNFFNLDALAEKVTEKRYKGKRKDYAHYVVNEPKEKVKEALRFRVAAYAGFCDMKTAAEFVCTKFARLIRSKLFNEETGEEERNGYIDFVKAINLRYDKDKGIPDENVLVRKLSAQ